MKTKLIYLEHLDQHTCEAGVLDILTENDKTIVVLDQTVFYPQGGGQPYDTGVIVSGDKTFNVSEVRAVDGIVNHIGSFQDTPFNIGDAVICKIDSTKRNFNSRIHSAGHLVDMALKKLDIDWKPGKGYHFPNGPYVEYSGSANGVDLEKLKKDLETVCNEIASRDIPIKISFAEKDTRIVTYDDFGIPCGGTHVGNLKEIVKVIIRKIKKEGENIRVSYAVEPGIT